MPQSYNNPTGGVPSSVGSQVRTDFYQKKALIEARKKEFFGQLAESTALPKHFGKEIVRYHWLPILHDANINDQGIDASGVSTLNEVTIEILAPDLTATGNGWVTRYAVGNGTTAALALTDAKVKAVDIFKELGVFVTSYAATKTALLALTPAWVITENTAVSGAGNLYGTSKDVGYIAQRFPSLTESGGLVNQVGSKRITLRGTIHKYGFYDSYTQESLDFDTDSELLMHINREMINASYEMMEDLLQIDLLNSAGVVKYAGTATSKATLSGETGAVDLVTYDDLMKLEVDLDVNRCPKDTKVFTGTRKIDNKTIDGARYMYIGTELVPMFKRMTDPFGNAAFVYARQYAAGTTLAVGEIGSVGGFRLIVVPEMMHFAGAGGTVTNNAGYRQSNGKYDVYPLLVVGSESFTTISFKADGNGSKFKIKHSKPGSPESYANDRFGETGFMSIKWYYGFMVLRPERLALLLTVAEY